MATWGSANIPSNQRDPRLEELVDMLDLPNGQYIQVRPVGPISSYAEHWFSIQKRDGGKSRIRKTCLNYDPKTGNMDTSRGCPYCADGLRFDRKYLGNVIVRELVATEPRNKSPHRPSEQAVSILGPQDDPSKIKCFLKQQGSKSWTPVRVLRASSTLALLLQGFMALNKVNGVPTDLSDPRYGRDVQIKYNKDAPGTSKYQATLEGTATPLTPDERKYLMYQIFDIVTCETLDAAQRDWARLRERVLDKDDNLMFGAAAGGGGEDEDYYGDNAGYQEQPQPRGGTRGRQQPQQNLDDDPPFDLDDDLEAGAVSSVPGRGRAAAPAQPRRPALPTVDRIYTLRDGKVKVLAVSNDQTKVKVKRPNGAEQVLPISAFAGAA